jgi:YfiH family protein
MTLDIITSDALSGIRHGFFTRKGGASSGVFEGLNCGLGSTDQADIVKINRSRAAQALDLGLEALCAANQVHSADVARIDAPQDGPAPKVDALVTDRPGLALVILTADCQPVLFADREAGVIGAAHAGWKGAIAGVLEETLDAMEALGATRGNISAVIGPTISQRAYEVGPEFFEDFLAEAPENARFFTNGEGDRYLFDLPAYGLHRLRQAGVGHAEWTRHCTYSDPERFYSYRRSVHRKEADYGRLISLIRL